MGFGASYIRFYSIYKHEGKEDEIARLNGLYIIVFSFLGGIASLCGIVLALNVGVFFNETYSLSDIDTARVLMFFLSGNMFLSFFAATFDSYITAHEKFVFQKCVNIGKTVLSPCLSIALLYAGFGSIGMVVVTTAITFLVDVINIVYCASKLRMKFIFRNPNIVLLKDIFVFSIFIAINQIIDQINWQTDKIILGKMINASAVAVYTIAATINGMYLSFSSAISSVFTPQIHAIQNEEIDESEKNKKMTDLFVAVGRIQFLVLMLIMTGFIFFGQYFIYKWAGQGYELSYFITLLLIVPATIPICQNVGIEIQRAKNKHKFRSIVYLAMAIINVAISILFCFLWGTIGVAIGTAISLIVANLIVMNIYYNKKLGIKVFDFYKSIATILPSMIIPICLGTCIIIFVNYDNILEFVLWVLIYVICYCVSVGIFGTNKKEKDFIIRRLKKLKTKNLP